MSTPLYTTPFNALLHRLSGQRDLVVVRMGHQRGSQVGSKLLNQSLAAIVAAVEGK